MVKKTTYRKKKTSKSVRRYFKIGLIFLSPFLIYLSYYFYKEFKAGYIKYKAFGTYIPNNYDIHGIDVSRYQQIINWKAVKSMKVENIKIDFVFIKATQGTKTVDYQYFQNKLRAKSAGLTIGAYHFFVASKDPIAQANLFSKVVSLKTGDLPPVVDIENEYGQSDEKIRKNLKTFLRLIERKYGVKPIIYTHANFYQNHLEGYFDEYPLWVAHYTKLGKPRVGKEWVFWQLSEEAHVNGIEGYVDFNVFKGSKEEFNQLKIK